MRKLFFVVLGWCAIIGGVLVIPVPVPMPFPAGAILILIGFAILTTHSKPFRRWLQRARHRYGWLDRSMLFFSRRSPKSVQDMVERTGPLAVGRYLRLREQAAARTDGATK